VPISAAEHLAFVRTQRSVSFLQTPAWAHVKTEWRGESLGWYDGRRLVGAGLVLHRPVPRLERFTLAYLPEGPVIDWTGEISVWLDPLAAHLKAHGAFAIRLGPPVRTATWSAAQVKEGITDPGIKRLTDMAGQWDDSVGARVTAQLRDAGWLPQSPENGFGVGHPQFKCTASSVRTARSRVSSNSPTSPISDATSRVPRCAWTKHSPTSLPRARELPRRTTGPSRRARTSIPTGSPIPFS
jgi:vancomycin resistance protein VanK